MKHVRKGVDVFVLSLIMILGAGAAARLNPAMQPADVVIQEVHGTASYCDGGVWRPLKKDMRLAAGAIIKTGAGSTVDLLLYSSRTALRLTPDSSVRLDKLLKAPGTDMAVTDTTLTLLSGSIAGTQRKLAAPSRFQINVAGGVARIVGTEYLVRADGAVTVVDGAVTVNYNQPHGGGSVRVEVPAGYSFDPATGQVVPTTPDYLQNIIADITTTRDNAEVFRVEGGATVVVRAEQPVTRFEPGNNGVGNGVDPQPPGNPPINDGAGTSPGDPGNIGGVGP